MRYIVLILLLLSVPALAGVDLVKVDKSENKMYLLDDGKVIKEYHVAFGANPKGHKQQEGDEKTPEGAYTLDFKKEDSSFYRAMHISYPNSVDLANAESNGVSAGGLIMVHGQRNWLGWFSPFTQKFNWRNGCIALTNSEMDEFILTYGDPNFYQKVGFEQISEEHIKAPLKLTYPEGWLGQSLPDSNMESISGTP